VLYILVRLLLVSFLLLLGLLLIQRIMWAWIGERPVKKWRADDTQRSKGRQRRERRQATPPRAPWWKVLGVSQEASLEEINRHYRQAMRMYHPDKVTGMAPEIIALAERRTKELNAAFSQAKRVRSGAAK
jgi:DnaJ domain